MAGELFLDTSGFYALLVHSDDGHRRAAAEMAEAASTGVRLATTDYVLDETATLLRVRGFSHLLKPFFDTLDRAKNGHVVWMEEERFAATRQLFLKYADQRVSFTDCFSFCVMREFRIRRALTKDRHFADAGFEALLR